MSRDVLPKYGTTLVKHLYMSRSVFPEYGTTLVKHPVYVKERSPEVWHNPRETPCIYLEAFSRSMAQPSRNTQYMSRRVFPEYGAALVKHPVYVKERSSEVWHIPRETSCICHNNIRTACCHPGQASGPDGVPRCSCYCTHCLLKWASVFCDVMLVVGGTVADLSNDLTSLTAKPNGQHDVTSRKN
jgi:hypothetical protein